MQSLEPSTAFALGILVGWGVLALGAGFLWLARPWIIAWAAGSAVPLLHLVGLRLRGTPPMIVIPAYVALRKGGLDVNLSALEALYLAHSREVRSVEDLLRLAAKRSVTQSP